MRPTLTLLAALLLAPLPALHAAEPIRVLVWDEQQPQQKQVYGDKFLGETIAEHLAKQPGLTVKTAKLDDPEQGLSDAALDATDVLIFWCHRKVKEQDDKRAEAVVKRVLEGKLSLIALHSAHWAKPFVLLMQERAKTDAIRDVPEANRATAKWEYVNESPYYKGVKEGDRLTPWVQKLEGHTWRLTLPQCVFPAWRADGKPSHVTTLKPNHPLAAGLPEKWDIPQTEMYGGDFHVPPPDEIVFREDWDKGERFNSGCVWKVGKGRVFYFRPGHETYPIFKQAEPLQVLENAVRWLPVSMREGVTRDRTTDWPQFRGPGGHGVVTDKALPPDTWSAKENVAWKYEVPGHGWSCPIVVGGKVFVTSCVTDAKVAAPKTGYYAPKDTKTHDGEHRWTLFCLDAATGKVLWEQVAHKGKPQHPIHVKASYASETPVSDGERVYAYFGNVGLFCYDLTGKQLWSKSWDVVPTQLDWGTGASPVLHEGRIYIVNDNEKASFIVALDKLTGKEVWKTDRAEKSNWATPFIWNSGKRTEIVTCGKGKVRSYDLDGKLLWEFGGMSSICVPSPVVAGDRLIISSGYEFGRPRPVFAVKPGASGDISLKKGETSNDFIAWSNDMAGAYHPTPLVLGEHLYVLYSTGFIACFEVKTGKPVYEKQRFGGSFTASPWCYDGKVFCLSEEGTTYVVKAGNEFELLGKNVLGEVSLATPAVADGKLFLRTREALYCIGKAK